MFGPNKLKCASPCQMCGLISDNPISSRRVRRPCNQSINQSLDYDRKWSPRCMLKLSGRSNTLLKNKKNQIAWYNLQLHAVQWQKVRLVDCTSVDSFFQLLVSKSESETAVCCKFAPKMQIRLPHSAERDRPIVQGCFGSHLSALHYSVVYSELSSTDSVCQTVRSHSFHEHLNTKHIDAT